MFPALRPLLNKGGAGRYITREESVERLLPVAERHLELLRTYGAALAGLPEGDLRRRVEGMTRLLRMEVGKISETLLSLGGPAPSGAGTMAPVALAPDADPVQVLADAERDFARALRDEIDVVHHQERTRAILGHNAEASNSRLDVLRSVKNVPVRD